GPGERLDPAHVGQSAEDLDGQLASVRIEVGQGLDGRTDGVGTDRDEGLDRRVAQTDVDLVVERRDERGHQLGARLQRRRDRGAFLAYAPVVVAQGRHQELGRRRTLHLRDLLNGDAAGLRLGLLEQPSDRGRRLAHVRVPPSRELVLATPSPPAEATGSVTSSRRSVPRTKTSLPSCLVTPSMPRMSSPSTCGGGRSSVSAVPNTSVTESTTSATSRLATTTTIHFVRRVTSDGARPKRTRRSTTGTTSPR